MTNEAGAASPDHRWRDRGRRLALLAASLLFSCLILEGYVRATWQSQWQIPQDAVRAPGIFSFRLKPDHEADFPTMDGTTFRVKTNARGFRGPLLGAVAHKPLTIVSLGDSFTFGWGVALEEHGLSRFMDRYRRAHPDRDVGHAWVASPSWDPKDYYFAYLTEAADLHPDLVVVGLFSGNDVMPADAARPTDPGEVPYVEKLPETPKPWLRSVDWLRAQFSGSPFIARIRSRQKPAAFALFENNPDTQRRLWDTTFFYVARLDAAVRQHGGHLVIVLYPSMLQVNTPDALAAGGYDPDMPERVVRRFADERHIELITLLDALKAGNARRDLYFPKDRHLTARGHEVAAETFVAQLGPIVDRTWQAKTRPADVP